MNDKELVRCEHGRSLWQTCYLCALSSTTDKRDTPHPPTTITIKVVPPYGFSTCPCCDGSGHIRVVEGR